MHNSVRSNHRIQVIYLLLLVMVAGCSKSGQVEDTDTAADATGSDMDDSNSSVDDSDFHSDDDFSDTGKKDPTDTGVEKVDFEECAAVAETAENTRQPADILFVIDNSRSLFDEIEMVRSNMNAFSSRIMDSGIDPHIVMVSCLPGECGNRGGVSYGICINPPLGAADGCQYTNEEPDTDDPEEPVSDDNNLPLYKHISTRVPSMKGLEWLVATYEDNNGLTEDGWMDMIRENATKHVVVVSDDGDQSTADSFASAFRALSPSLEDFQFHGIFAYGAKDLVDADNPCSTYAAPSSPDADPPIYWDTYSTLVEMTSGVSGDLCTQDFDPVFEALGSNVIASSKINCEWQIPTPPDGLTMDATLVNVEFFSDTTESYVVGNIPSAEYCGAVSNGWYYDDAAAPSRIFVCPDTCSWFQAEKNARLNIQFGCATETIIVE